MVSYETTVSDLSRDSGLKLLVAGEHFDLSNLAGHSLVHAGAGITEDISRTFPDALLIDATLIDRDIADYVGTPHFRDMPIVVATNDNLADRAGLLLDHRDVRFVAHSPAPEELEETIRSIRRVQHAADSGDIFDPLEKIEALRRDAERMAAAIAELASGGTADAADTADRIIDAARIRAHIRARRAREKFFPAEILADPAWDMLLDLAAARLEGKQVAVSSLCIAASVPTTTALRWIKTMIERGYFQRSPDPEDGRRAFISLTTPAADLMTKCLQTSFNHPGQ